MYTIPNLKKKFTLVQHTDAVYYISELDDGRLVSCSRDKTICVWKFCEDCSGYKCIKVITGHSAKVYKIIPISQNRMASCSEDKTIRIWSVNEPYKCLNTLLGHSGWIHSIIQLKDLRLASISYDFTLRFWDLKAMKCQKENTVKNIFCSFFVSSNILIELNGDKIMIGGGNTMFVVDCIHYKIIKTIQDDTLGKVYSFLLLRDGNIVVGTYKYIIVLNSAFECKLKKENCHTKEITAIVQVSENSFASCSWDRLIKIWEY